MRTPAASVRSANAQIAIADYVPMGTAVTPGVVKMSHEAAYLATWRIDGITFETRDPQEIAIQRDVLAGFLLSLSGGRWSIWTHKLRRHVRERLSADYPNPFCAELLGRYYDSFDAHRQMATELYLTLVYRPEPANALKGLFGRSKAVDIRALREREDQHLTEVDDAAKSLEASLKAFGPQRLATFGKGEILFSNQLAFYGYLINGFWEDVPLRHASINEYLPTSRLHFGDRNGMLEIWHPEGTKYARFLDIQEYPQASEPGMCNGLLYGDYEYIETQSMSMLNRQDGLKALRDQRGHLIATEDVSERQIAQMDLAQDQLQAGTMELGEYHFVLAVFGDSLAAVARNIADARSSLANVGGFKMAVVDVVPECAWFSQLPGNWRMRPREAKLTSRNFAALAPFHNFGGGKREGNPWGEALVLMQTPNAQPFYLNFHTTPDDEDSTDEKAAGNTFICGATGSGKTTLQMMLLASATKYPGFRALFLDLDRGAEIGIRAMGGKYVAIARGEPTGFNPFQQPANPVTERFCIDLVRKLIAPQGTPILTAKEEDSISAAVSAVLYELKPGLRRLAAIDQLLPHVGGNSLRVRRKKWIGNGPLGWAFDNPVDTQAFERHQIFGYDYTEFLDDPEVRTPILMYLLHVSDQLKTGGPFVRILEEFWKALLDETLMSEARRNLKTDRKLSALGVYVTQSPGDVLSSPIGRTIVEQCVTQIYLPNPRADAADYIEGFKTTEAEYQIIRNLGEHSRMFLVKQGHRSSLVRFDLGGMTDVLNVISGSLDNVRLLDELRAGVGDDPGTWLPLFHQRIAQRRETSRAWSEARAARSFAR